MVKIRVQYLTTTIDFEWNKEPLQETIESLFSKFNFHGSSSDYILRNEASPSKAALTDQVLFISKILIYRCKFANFILLQNSGHFKSEFSTCAWYLVDIKTERKFGAKGSRGLKYSGPS